jgi:ABC-type multidrug transport system fused ATPase/permease subunit
VKAQGREPDELREFAASSRSVAHDEVQLDLQRHLVGQGQQLTVLIVLLLLVVVTGALVMNGHARGVAGSLVFVYLLRRVSSQFGVLSGLRSAVAAMSGPVAEITRILQEEDARGPADGTRPLSHVVHGIRFEHVAFAYRPGVPVLRDVTFDIARGATTALVGRTGAGKTTIIRLLLRFYDPESGLITIDGVDLRELRLASLRRAIALVSQDVPMLHASLRENLIYGVPDVTDAGLARALERARLADLIARLPEGLETRVGDRGATLSGGERQRVAIARALLKDAELLVLDEATSALDVRTEQQIQEAIGEVLRGRTAVVIAHRLSTIRHADQIVVLEAGQVIEQGRPRDLLAGESRFGEYWRAQAAAPRGFDAVAPLAPR